MISCFSTCFHFLIFNVSFFNFLASIFSSNVFLSRDYDTVFWSSARGYFGGGRACFVFFSSLPRFWSECRVFLLFGNWQRHLRRARGCRATWCAVNMEYSYVVVILIAKALLTFATRSTPRPHTLNLREVILGCIEATFSNKIWYIFRLRNHLIPVFEIVYLCLKHRYAGAISVFPN